MAYAHINFAALKTQLAARLGDASKIFWVDTELGILLTEAMRAFGLLASFWRERGTFSTTAGTAFYDLPTLLANGPDFLLASTVTDRDVIASIQYALLEPATSQTTWTGTEMFTYSAIANTIEHRLNQFLSDTGIVVNRALVNVLGPPISREVFNQKTVDIRRMAWLGAPPIAYYHPLWRDDERALTAADQRWSVDPGQPESYSIMSTPPLQVQLSPPPLVNGQLEALTVDAVALDPATTATVLGIHDDLTPAIKWGALSDLLGQDGIARDPARSQFAESMYQQYVRFARVLPVVVHAEIQGLPLIASTLQELESSTPNWQNIQGMPSDIAMASANLIALSPVPDGVYSVTMDVVRRTPIPANGSVQVQIGREQVDMVLDYAEHLALFKAMGAEWKATLKQAQNFLVQAMTYNQRISAAVRSSMAVADQSQRQKTETTRRSDRGVGLGALKGMPNG
jgi:hypothetical protein